MWDTKEDLPSPDLRRDIRYTVANKDTLEVQNRPSLCLGNLILIIYFTREDGQVSSLELEFRYIYQT